jgi:hypothetical protein
MNTPEAPLSPETLDELLSADIDGEFERAARDFGFTVDDARAAMDASPETPRRRADLVRARNLLAVPVPTAASVTSQLAATALDRSDDLRSDDLSSARARRTRAMRAVVTVGAAAAVIAGIVAVAAINHHGATTSKSTAASANAPRPGAATRPTTAASAGRSVDFGDVTRPARLRAVIEMRLRTTIATPAQQARRQHAANRDLGPDIVTKLASWGTLGLPGPVALQGPQGLEGVQGLQGDVGIAGPQGPTGATGATGPTEVNSGTGVQGGIGPLGPSGGPLAGNLPAPKFSAPARPATTTFGRYSGVASYAESACATTIERRAHQRSAPVLSGYGTDARRPVVIVVFSQAHRYVAYVLAASDCAVVSHQTLP